MAAAPFQKCLKLRPDPTLACSAWKDTSVAAECTDAAGTAATAAELLLESLLLGLD
jgi:hypothetical protein